MIVTLTPNPSTDATLELDGPLERGAVLRLKSTTHVAGGKGVNVAHAAKLAGADALAVFPAGADDPFVPLVATSDVPHHDVIVAGSVRTNTTVTEPDGTTTKLNGPGPELSESERAELTDALIAAVPEGAGQWVVLAGSLPPGAPADWYATLVDAVREACPEAKVAVDTSDAPMIALGGRFPASAPDLIKPNGLELGQLVGVDGQELERLAEDGDFGPVVEAARKVNEQGVENVLVTLGGAGAVLVTPEGAWKGTPPPTTVASTVGAGDSSLTGFILATLDGEDSAGALRRAVAYGSAAAGLPGTTLPRPDQADVEHTRVSTVD